MTKLADELLQLVPVLHGFLLADLNHSCAVLVAKAGGIHVGQGRVDVDGWLKEVDDIRNNYYPQFGNHLPHELTELLDSLESRLKSAK